MRFEASLRLPSLTLARGRKSIQQSDSARQTKLLHIAVFSKIEKNSALAEYPAQQFRRVETSRFQEESVLAGSERPIVEQKVQRVVRMVVEHQQFIAVVLPVEIPHCVRYIVGQMDGAGLADHVVKTFDLRRGAMAKTVADDEVLLWLLVSIVPARNEESIPIDLVPKPSEFSIPRSQDGLTRPRQFIVVAA